ncbi:MAG: hypothetical protein RIA69_07085 [Cyclobacteriaceae bacterium]
MATEQSINMLKELLFEEERKKYSELSKTIESLQKKIDNDISARKRPDAEVQELVEQISEIMPEKMGPAITATLKTQIRESRDEMVQALFPIIGQMVKKYIQTEMLALTERIDKQLESTFSIDHIINQIRSWFIPSKASELLIKGALEATIEEIFIIEEESGILMASFSQGSTVDQDMVAGMLTAIKAFVEDAFNKKDQKLASVSYDQFNIYIQSFQKFYIAVVLSGVMDANYKRQLDDKLLAFVKEATKKSLDNNEELTSTLEHFFGKDQNSW